MRDTPRTDLMVEHAPIGLRTNAAFEQSCDLCRTLERELNEANSNIIELQSDVNELKELNEYLRDRIKRLKEAGDRMVNEGWNEPHLAGEWRKAKEAKQ